MEIKGELTKEQLEKLKDVINPTLREIIKLSNLLEVDTMVLVKYFIDKENNN